MDEATTKTRFWTHRRRLWAVGAAVATLLLTAGGHWLPDWGLRYGLLRSLRDLGWSQVSVAAANLSLFNGAIVVRQVTAGEEPGAHAGHRRPQPRFPLEAAVLAPGVAGAPGPGGRRRGGPPRGRRLGGQRAAPDCRRRR
ncbi:MAG: hypothetical protein NVV74_06990 [Magnetospirillum sp.]|nr:hypothetical protein [Magnetospirillum sp.]